MHSEFFLITIISLSFSRAVWPLEDPTPPPASNYAAMARYIMHMSDWISIATISSQDNITGYPFVSVKSVSDGPTNVSTGIPYLYMTDEDLSAHDLQKDIRVSIVATLAQSDYCKHKSVDPQNPTCPKVMLSGKFKQINKQDKEYIFGQTALFDRHPEMKTWPPTHKFYVAKIEIEKIYVLDSFGGAVVVNVSDYFKVRLN